MNIVTYLGFTPEAAIFICVLLVLLCFSAVASGAEVAFFSLSPSEIKELEDSEKVSHHRIIRLLADPGYLLATILLLNNLVNIGIVVVSDHLLSTLFEIHRFKFLFTGVLATFILLLFGEVLPKVFAQESRIKVATFTSLTLLISKYLFYPVSSLLIKMNRYLDHISHKNTDISIEDLADAVDLAKTSSDEEQKMLSGIVDFAQREVEEIMIGRIDIVALENTASFDEVRHMIIDSGYSRLPIYEEDIDNIKGVLYVKDLLAYLNEPGDFGWQKLMREPYFIPLHRKLNTVLEDFQANKVHMAFIVDEYGSTQGLVTMEDLLEEVVGEISDESDEDESFYKRINENTYIFDGKTHIIDIIRVLELEGDIFEDIQGRAETLAGLLLELKKTLVKKDDELTFRHIRFIVTAMEGHRIDKVKIILRNA